MLHHGRFPPAIVLEVARAMLAELAAMETAGLVHGDVRVETVLLLTEGNVCLPQPGLRGMVRPHEGIAHGDLAGGLRNAGAERVAGGASPAIASDLFACGCVWWQMLCGRPPLGGGDAMSRLRAAQTAAIDDWRQWAADVPEPLAGAIDACLQGFAEAAGVDRRPGKANRPAATQRASSDFWLLAGGRAAASTVAGGKACEEQKTASASLDGSYARSAGISCVAWPLWVAVNRPVSGQAALQVEKPRDIRTAEKAPAACQLGHA